MSLTDRDKKLLKFIVPLAFVVLFWFLLLAPARSDLSVAGEQLEQAQERNEAARAAAAAAGKGAAPGAGLAASASPDDLAAVVSLGKAVPSTVDPATLLYQLQRASRGTGIRLGNLTMGRRNGTAAGQQGQAGQPPAQPGTAPPTGGTPPAASGQAAPAAAPPAGAQPAAAQGGKPAPAAGAAAQVQSVPVEVELRGRFGGLTDFFHRAKRFVELDADRLVVRGRLVRIDGISFAPSGYPKLDASLQLTVFVAPKPEGLTVAPAPGPAGAAPAPAPAPAPAAKGGGTAAQPTGAQRPAAAVTR